MIFANPSRLWRGIQSFVLSTQILIFSCVKAHRRDSNSRNFAHFYTFTTFAFHDQLDVLVLALIFLLLLWFNHQHLHNEFFFEKYFMLLDGFGMKFGESFTRVTLSFHLKVFRIASSSYWKLFYLSRSFTLTRIKKWQTEERTEKAPTTLDGVSHANECWNVCGQVENKFGVERANRCKGERKKFQWNWIDAALSHSRDLSRRVTWSRCCYRRFRGVNCKLIALTVSTREIRKFPARSH